VSCGCVLDISLFCLYPPSLSFRRTPFSLPLFDASFALHAHSHTTDNRHRPRRMRLPSPNRQTPRPAHPNPPLRSKTPLPRRPVVELQGRRGGMVVESHCHVRLPQIKTLLCRRVFCLYAFDLMGVEGGRGWGVLFCVVL
jgi:hypothetical protein